MKLQKEAMDDIFVALVDSLHHDLRVDITPPIPYPKGVEITDSMKRVRDEIWKRNRLNYRRQLDSVRKDTSKLFIVVQDTLYAFQDKYIEYRNQLGHEIQFNWDSTLLAGPYKIELTDFNNNHLFRFLYASALPKGRDLWKNENINGYVFFSRIVFDNTLKYGILSGGYMCGRLCGQGGWIFIERINNKWVVNRIEINEVS